MRLCCSTDRGAVYTLHFAHRASPHYVSLFEWHNLLWNHNSWILKFVMDYFNADIYISAWWILLLFRKSSASDTRQESVFVDKGEPADDQNGQLIDDIKPVRFVEDVGSDCVRQVSYQSYGRFHMWALVVARKWSRRGAGPGGRMGICSGGHWLLRTPRSRSHTQLVWNVAHAVNPMSIDNIVRRDAYITGLHAVGCLAFWCCFEDFQKCTNC